jgi:hypothetical protein
MRVFSSLLVFALAASSVLFGSTYVYAEPEGGNVVPDKNSIVCAALVPCDKDGNVMKEYLNPKTFGAFFCLERYRRTCQIVKKEINKMKREQRRERRRQSSSRR